MQPDQRDWTLLRDMRQYAQQVAFFVANSSLDDFSSDSLLRLAVERCLEIVGEAASHVSTDFQTAHPEIPWRQIVGQRNVLAHEYGAINPVRIWETASTRMTPLIAEIDRIIAARNEPVAETRR